jgi:hypothetical protein
MYTEGVHILGILTFNNFYKIMDAWTWTDFAKSI